jgi:hypothetical protein
MIIPLHRGERLLQLELPLKLLTSVIIDDDIDEPNETIIFGLSNFSNTSIGTNSSHTLTIVDNDDAPTIEFALALSDADEDVGTHNVIVNLNRESTTQVTVDYAATDITALGGGVDYTLAPGTLTFAAGVTTQTIAVTIIDDIISESDETFRINLTNQNYGSIGAQNEHTVTIRDDDGLPEVEFALNFDAVNEDVGTHDIVVELSNPSSSQQTVNYAVTSGTATGGGVDFTLNPGTLTFAAGETIQNITITIIDDLIDEPDETVVVTLSGQSAGLDLGTTNPHTLTIIDNDDPPEVEFSLAASSASEDVGTHDIQVELSGPSGNVITVDYAVTGGTATGGGVDYTLAAGTLTFAAGTTTQNITVSVVDDALDEPDETVIIALSGPSNATLGTVDEHTFTIIDNDSAPTVEFTLAASSASEGVGTHDIQVELSGPSGFAVTVDYAVIGGTATGGGVDFTLAAGTLTFAAGTTTQNITISVVDDALPEPDETVIIALSNPSNATLGTVDEHTFTIIDNDSAPTVEFALAASSANEDVGTHDIQVELSGPSGYVVTVDYAVTGGTATGGGVDFTLAAGTLTFAAGTTTQNITVSVVDDALAEPDETVIIALSNPSNATLGTEDEHTFTIIDNDSAPTVEFTLAASSANEDVGTHDIQVELSGPSGYVVTVDYAVTGGTATGGGVDFTLAAGTLTFAAGTTTQNITVSVVDDAIDEPDETVIIALSGPSNATLGTEDEHTFTIIDNDSAPTVEFTLAASSANEDVGTHDIQVELSGPSGYVVTVDYAVTGGTATGGGVDFTLAAGTLTFAAGTTTQNITVSVVDDAIDEPDETVIIALSGPSNATLGTVDEHTFTIIDNDSAPTVEFTLAASSANEDVGTHDIQVELSGPSSFVVTVDYAVTGGTATGGGVDYTLAAGTLTFAAGTTTQNITISVVDDAIAEPDETVIIALSNPSNATLGTEDEHTFTIIDNDSAPTVEFTLAASSANEDVGTHDIQVELSGPSGYVVTVDYAVTGGTATGGGVDYTLAAGTLTFAAGTTTQNITVTVVDDAIDEPDETVIIALSGPSNATLGTEDEHTFTIIDNDSAHLRLSLH